MSGWFPLEPGALGKLPGIDCSQCGGDVFFDRLGLLYRKRSLSDDWWLSGTAVCLTCLIANTYHQVPYRGFYQRITDPALVPPSLVHSVLRQGSARQPDQTEPPVSLAAIIAAYYQERA